MLLAVAVLPACATETTDTRPETADYIIEAILAPACGRGACHSSVTVAAGYAFDTLDAAKASMKKQSENGQKLVVANDPSHSRLVTILSDGNKPMPADAPLPDADIALITSWVAAGAEGLP